MILSGKALQKLMAICEAQGGYKEPKTSAFQKIIEAPYSGVLNEINNREVARVKFEYAYEYYKANNVFSIKPN